MIKFLLKHSYLIILLVLYLFLAFFTLSEYLVNWDAGQFALGTVNYDLGIYQPHPPGYFLFIYGGKLLNYLFKDANFSLIFLNIIAGFLAIYFFYKLILAVTDSRKISFWTSLLFLVNPIFWYYHNVALTYTFEALAIILLGYLTFMVVIKNKNNFIISLIASAILIGFRQSIILTVLPFLFIQFFYLPDKLKNLLKGFFVFLIITLLWFTPFSLKVGGVFYGLKLVLDQFISVSPTVSNNWINASQIKFFIVSVLWGFNIGYLLLLLNFKDNWKYLKRRPKIFLLFIPVIFLSLFYIFIHLGEVGYILSFLPLLYLLIVYPVARLIYTRWGNILLLILIIIESLLFLNPLAVYQNKKINEINYPRIVDHDLHLKETIEVVEKYSPDNLLLISLRGEYFDKDKNIKRYQYDEIRALSYYLPQYPIYDLLGVKDLYFFVKDYRYEEIHAPVIYFLNQSKTLLILADYLHPSVYPKELIITPQSGGNNPIIYYYANISNINEFNFDGFNFRRLRN